MYANNGAYVNTNYNVCNFKVMQWGYAFTNCSNYKNMQLFKSDRLRENSVNHASFEIFFHLIREKYWTIWNTKRLKSHPSRGLFLYGCIKNYDICNCQNVGKFYILEIIIWKLIIQKLILLLISIFRLIANF